MKIQVTFTDGSTVVTNILLGADGINSAVRRSFVPTSAPKRTGWVAFRSVFDARLVEHIPEVLEEANWGPDRTFFASRLGKGLFTVVGGYQGDPDDPNSPYKDAVWNEEDDVKVLKEFYKDWHPAVRAMIEASPHTRKYPSTFASSLETWVHGEGDVTFAGDAAHAYGGAFAAGGSLALDDAYASSLAIGTICPSDSSRKPSRAEIEGALKLYERTRKAHTDRVLSVVREGNKKRVESLGRIETDGELRSRMKRRADPYWIHEHDVEAAFAEALAEEEEVARGKEVEQARL
jgi:salicylate hydroxylase